jgi:L-seryl-tRNA(Ser) seleniumtransferase
MFRIPSGLQQIIPPAAAKKVLELLHQPALTQAVKDAAQKIGWPEMQASGQLQEIWQQAKQWMESTLHSGQSPIPLDAAIMNGTGRIFHSKLGGVPLPLGVADQAARMLSYMTVQSIEANLRQLLCQQSGAEDALVVISIEHAIGLLHHLPQAADGWLIPRSDYLSWSDEAHFGNCLDHSSKPSIPIGSISLCSEQDLVQGLKGNQHGLLSLSPNRLTEPTSSSGQSTTDLRQYKTPQPLVYADVLMDGSLIELETDSFPNVTVANRLSSGSALVLLPGDRLLGGPACGIILGAKSCIEPLRAAARKQRLMLHPLIACTLQLTLSKQTEKRSWSQQPVGSMLTNGVANLKDRAKRLQFQIQACEHVVSCEILESQHPIGDYLWERASLPGVALEIELTDAEQWVATAQKEKGVNLLCERRDKKLLLHLRSLDPADDRLLADLFPPAPPQSPAPSSESST